MATIVGPGPLATAGPNFVAYAVAASDSIKTGQGRLWGVLSTGGTSVTLTDGATSFTITLTAGQYVPFPGGWPFVTGLIVSAVTGSIALAFS